MVAYSFKRQFVTPIRLGLSAVRRHDGPIECEDRVIHPKRQTIRAVGRRHHARPGDELQLYHGMRTKQCFLIGKARCTAATPIFIRVDGCGWVVKNPDSRRPKRERIETVRDLDAFAHSDGFQHWMAMVEFWQREHPGVEKFTGILIEWEPTR